MLGQVQEEIIEVGIYATNEMSFIEEVEAALEVKSNEAQMLSLPTVQGCTKTATARPPVGVRLE